MQIEDLFRLKEMFPRHPNVMGKERYFNAAVLIPLVYLQGEYCFLFQKRAAWIRQGGEISFPGGEFDPETDQSCIEAATRETVEELGINRELIDIICRLDTLVSPRGITVDSFLAVLHINSLQELQPEKSEVERVFTLPVSWFEQNQPQIFHLQVMIHPDGPDNQGEKTQILPVRELDLPKHYSKPWPGLLHRVFIYNTPEEVIWGMTAELVHEIIHKLQKT